MGGRWGLACVFAVSGRGAQGQLYGQLQRVPNQGRKVRGAGGGGRKVPGGAGGVGLCVRGVGERWCHTKATVRPAAMGTGATICCLPQAFCPCPVSPPLPLVLCPQPLHPTHVPFRLRTVSCPHLLPIPCCPLPPTPVPRPRLPPLCPHHLQALAHRLHPGGPWGHSHLHCLLTQRPFAGQWVW